MLVHANRPRRPLAFAALVVALAAPSVHAQPAEAPAVAAPAPPPMGVPGPSPQEIFDRDYLWFKEPAGRGWPVPLEGRYGRPLRPVEYYLKLGHPEYATIYSKRQRQRITLISVGASLMGVGVMALGVGVGLFELSLHHTNSNCGFNQPCGGVNANLTALYAGGAVGAVGILGGLAILLVGALRNPQPIPAAESRRLADEYNRGLRQQLGLPAGVVSLLRRTTVAPVLSPQLLALTAAAPF